MSTTDQLQKRAASSAPPMQRADELLRQMTIEEKAMQLSAIYPMALIGTDGLIRSQLDAQLKHGIGQISALGAFGHKSPETVAKTANAIQRYLLRGTNKKRLLAWDSHPDILSEDRSEEHTSELQSLRHLVCRLLLE